MALSNISSENFFPFDTYVCNIHALPYPHTCNNIDWIYALLHAFNRDEARAFREGEV